MGDVSQGTIAIAIVGVILLVVQWRLTWGRPEHVQARRIWKALIARNPDLERFSELEYGRELPDRTERVMVLQFGRSVEVSVFAGPHLRVEGGDDEARPSSMWEREGPGTGPLVPNADNDAALDDRASRFVATLDDARIVSFVLEPRGTSVMFDYAPRDDPATVADLAASLLSRLGAQYDLIRRDFPVLPS